MAKPPKQFLTDMFFDAVNRDDNAATAAVIRSAGNFGMSKDELLASRDASGDTILHAAARHAGRAVLNTLAREGANVRLLNAQRQTALHVSVEANRPDVSQAFLELGVNITAEDGQGRTALEVAEARRLGAETDLLRKYGGERRPGMKA